MTGPNAMNQQSDILETSFDMLIDVEPGEVAAGGALVLRCAARATPGRDLRGQSVQILDDTGSTVGSLTFSMLDGATNTTEPGTFAAPTKLGSHGWRAVFAGAPEGHAPGGEAIHDFFFTVVAHRASVLVWGAPSAIAAGQSFTVTLGLKCSGGCDMAGRKIQITDASGAEVAMVQMGADQLHGTSGLHETKVTLQAPAEVSRQTWQARIARDDAEPPHEAATAAFGLNFVAPPEHRIEITVLDAETKAPLRGASITAHPFSATTNAEGVASMMVCAGSYTVWVSAAGHDPVCKYLDMSGDHTSVAELSPEAKEDPDAFYY
ncbi:MAG: carboxypeptidase-like regulatory domain-containing protein [Rhodobacteraceae bacterium]|nr:carboxypeptidase-like regulatory domain-containing protein [Paracoccaceae bacterium]